MVVLRLPGTLLRAVRRVWRGLRAWQVWSLAEPLRSVIIGVPLLSLAAIAVTALQTRWLLQQGAIYVALLCCGAIAIEATRTVKEPQGTTVRDLQPIWYLAIAIILAPAYAFFAPIPLMAYRLIRARRMIVYRRVYSNATLSLAYGFASVVFHAIPATVAGSVPGAGSHVLGWTAVVASCAVIGWLINGSLLLSAIRLADPEVRFRDMFGSRESLVADAVEVSLAVSITLVVAISPEMMALALPTVIMQRRYLMHMQLAAQARIDSKTGLLNAGAWQREAAAEFSRALRTRAPLALAMVDIDHFKSVSDTAGFEVRDQLLRDVAGMLKEQMRGNDLVGRFSAEEFVILLPRTGGDEAKRISERIRDHIAGEPIAIESGSQAGFVFRLTVSIGIAVMTESRRALTELIGAADSALDEARSTGWNKVHVLADDSRDAGTGDPDLTGW